MNFSRFDRPEYDQRLTVVNSLRVLRFGRPGGLRHALRFGSPSRFCHAPRFGSLSRLRRAFCFGSLGCFLRALHFRNPNLRRTRLVSNTFHFLCFRDFDILRTAYGVRRTVPPSILVCLRDFGRLRLPRRTANANATRRFIFSHRARKACRCFRACRVARFQLDRNDSGLRNRVRHSRALPRPISHRTM
ncbi:hypothetical protein WL37_11510 [Burkholderia ubonensis]|nr:hypothetical protein WL37_11510 [Burkholderia ubonensis]